VTSTTPSATRALPLGVSGPLDAEERVSLRRLVLYGIAVRILLALLFEWTGLSRILAPDEQTYLRNGRQIARFWAGELFGIPPALQGAMPRGYFYINAVFQTVFGGSAIPIKILNSLVGGLAGVLVYRLARELCGVSVAQRSAKLVLFFPSLILWSTLNIRDAWVVLLLLFISVESLAVVRAPSLGTLVGLLAGVYAVSLFRDYLVVVVAIPPVVALALGRSGHQLRSVIVALVAAAALLLLVQSQIGGERVERFMSLETMSSVRDGMASGDSAFQENVDISTPGAALSFLPIGVAYFLFSPFPWQMTSALKLLSLPEMLFLYYLTPAIVRGVGQIVRTRLRESLQILLLTVLLTVSYALGEGNVGTLYRHRAQVMPFFLVFAAVGLEMRLDRKPAVRSR
jgi:4-amino-4-deoxy-L-arabinose transferase-like glycosyltransferase